ncbi:uncharacterized protein [Aegilops tauschii subsp. strangulata]|uniref:uncharacterized protein n=1 Tax=Aegilops tauschii subsp. strangulata TaxID=200361 RepID=UPI001E1CAD6C|nr:uncharacterized protein LOC120962388 [Aegilops tauschii subsp. strangulata]
MPSFPESMVGKTLQLLLPYHDAIIRGVERSKDDKLTRVKIEALPGVAFSAGELRLESTEGLKFVGALHMDDVSGHECTLTVHDDQVHYCGSCTEVRVPAFPPFSETMVGMTVRFSGSDPYSIELYHYVYDSNPYTLPLSPPFYSDFNDAAEQKIKVAINGYGKIRRALARAALQSEGVALVAVNDLSGGDEISCMFRDIWDFGVKNCTCDILKGVDLYKESNPAAVPWYMSGAQFVVETSECTQDADHYKNRASSYSRCSDLKLFEPLETIVGRSSTTPNSSRAPILRIEPVTPSDAKAVRDCFPLWMREEVGSVVCVQGVDMTFELAGTDMMILSNTQPSLNFAPLLRWCFDMLSQIPEAGECHVQTSEKPRRT